jgi:hypothetical protein
MRKSSFLKKLKSELLLKNPDLKTVTALVFKLQGEGKNKFEYENIYVLLLEYINKQIGIESTNDLKDDILDLILDVLWHQENGLKKLNEKNQIELNKVLNKVAQFDFRKSEHSERLFFSISKSMDLIKYQSEFGNSDELIDLYKNHFDILIRERTEKYLEKNWL